MKKMLVLMLAALLLLACGQTAVAADPTPAPVAAAETPVPTEESDVVQIVQTPAPTDEPTPEPTDELTPEPTEEPMPAPTRAPKDGDICPNFPDYDTGVDADYSYQSDELKIAITVHQENLPDDKQNRQLAETYYVADIWVRNIQSLRTAFANGEYGSGAQEGDALARQCNAILAINGSYNQGLVLQNGTVLHSLRANKGWNSGSVGLIYQDGSLKTFFLSKETFNLKKEIQNGALYGWQFGPIIIRDGEEGPGATSYGTLGYKARNILGYYEPGHYVIVTCDNRGDDARGMNAQMMIALMKSLGVKEAFNLDGGTSAVMVFMGEIINQPTPRFENGKAIDGRPIVDMLVFGEFDEKGVAPDLSTLTPSKFKDKD